MKYFFLFCLLVTKISYSNESLREFGSMFDLKDLENRCEDTGSLESCLDFAAGLVVHDTQKERRTLLFQKGCKKGNSSSCSFYVDEIGGISNFNKSYDALNNKFKRNNDIALSHMGQLLYYKLKEESPTGVTLDTEEKVKHFISYSCKDKSVKGCELVKLILPFISKV